MTSIYRPDWSDGPIGPGFLLMLSPVLESQVPGVVPGGSLGSIPTTPVSCFPETPEDLGKCPKNRDEAVGLAILLLARD